MEKRWHQRPVGWLVGIGTAGAMAAMLAVAASSGGAATTEKVYEASATPVCVIAPGVLNVEVKNATLGMRFKGPETVQEGQTGIELTEASVSFHIPAELTNPFISSGVTTLKGHLESLVVDAANMEPAELNVVKSPLLPQPYEVPYREDGPTEIRFPSEGSFSFGPYSVTGTKGQSASLSFGSAPGFIEEAEGGYRATGSGVEFTVEGFNASGEKKIGPLTAACNVPGGTELAQIPIAERAATSEASCTYTTRSPHALVVEPRSGPAAGGVNVTITGEGVGSAAGLWFGGTKTDFEVLSPSEIRAITPPGSGQVEVEVEGPSTRCPSEQYLGIGSYTYEHAIEHFEYRGWTVAGSITDRRLGQAIVLPQGSVFSGVGELNPVTNEGILLGTFVIPPFTAPLRLFGPIEAGFGMTLTQWGMATGSLAPAAGGDKALALSVRLGLGVTSVSLLGLTIPTRCTTAEPLSLALSDTLSREALLKGAWSFAGTIAIPPLRCEGGLLGRLFGAVLTGLLSGPEDPYSLSVSAPAG
jgi:hypothetical protein